MPAKQKSTEGDNANNLLTRGCLESTCSQLRDPAEAPKDGTVILASVGWPWLVPAMWCEYADCWVMASASAEDMHTKISRYWDNETENHIDLKGWLPMPLLHELRQFDPVNSGVRSLCQRKNPVD